MEYWNEDVVGAILMLACIPGAILILLARHGWKPPIRERSR